MSDIDSDQLFPVIRQVPNGSWRFSLMKGKVPFDDERKGVFLQEYAKHCRISHAAKASGVLVSAVQTALKNDKIFAAAVEEAKACYKDRLLAHHQDLVFNGTKKLSYDNKGNLVGEEIKYPIKLIEMELRKHAGYEHNSSVDVNVRAGGVLVAPSSVKTIESWEEKYGQKPIIESTAEEVVVDQVTDRK